MMIAKILRMDATIICKKPSLTPRKHYIMSKRSPIHVCSLSMSALNTSKEDLTHVNTIYDNLSPEEQQSNKEINLKLNKLRWVNLSMEYNRQTQLQYVFQHLGDKGSNPRLRNIRMKPVFAAWKREILRQKWREVSEAINSNSIHKNLDKKFDSFAIQRATLSARSMEGSKLLANPPVLDLLGLDDPLDFIDSFQTKEAQKSEFFLQGIDFLQSSACKTITEIPETEDNDPLGGGDVRSRLKSRGLELDDDQPEKLISGAERALRQYQDHDVKQKSSGLTKTIIIIVAAIVAIALIIIFVKGKSVFNAPQLPEECLVTNTPKPKPTRAPKNTPTPTPTPKKGWFK